MNIDTLSTALDEALRFVANAQPLLDALRDDSGPNGTGYGMFGTKESGAVRRSSMDLTRALADLRRPG